MHSYRGLGARAWGAGGHGSMGVGSCPSLAVKNWECSGMTASETEDGHGVERKAKSRGW